MRAAPGSISRRAAPLARRMPANWRPHCPDEREVRIRSAGDSEAADCEHKTLLCSMNRAVGLKETAETQSRRFCGSGYRD
jgi:hypothetical protein